MVSAEKELEPIGRQDTGLISISRSLDGAGGNWAQRTRSAVKYHNYFIFLCCPPALVCLPPCRPILQRAARSLYLVLFRCSHKPVIFPSKHLCTSFLAPTRRQETHLHTPTPSTASALTHTRKRHLAKHLDPSCQSGNLQKCTAHEKRGKESILCHLGEGAASILREAAEGQEGPRLTP